MTPNPTTFASLYGEFTVNGVVTTTHTPDREFRILRFYTQGGAGTTTQRTYAVLLSRDDSSEIHVDAFILRSISDTKEFSNANASGNLQTQGGESQRVQDVGCGGRSAVNPMSAPGYGHQTTGSNSRQEPTRHTCQNRQDVSSGEAGTVAETLHDFRNVSFTARYVYQVFEEVEFTIPIQSFIDDEAARPIAWKYASAHEAHLRASARETKRHENTTAILLISSPSKDPS